jgi:pilus assembly protein CpaB
MKQKFMIVLALVFGLLAFFLTRYQIKLERERILGSAKDVIYIRAKKSLAEGEKISATDIEANQTKKFPKPGQVEIEWKDRDNIIGRKLAKSVFKGEDLKWYQIEEDIVSKKEGLAAIIPQRLRAVSIAVDTTSSVTGLVRPGHHVDIVGTFHFPEMKGDKALDTITLTILQNVYVLATGTQLAGSSRGAQTGIKGYNTVTLALTPNEVEMIIFASQKGKLSLSLRNYEDAMVLHDLQSVNFKYLEQNIPNYTKQREQFMKNYNR